jgi:hypothetical protein
MEGMNQFGIHYIYTWKCHNGNLYKDILNKQKHLLKKKKPREQEGKTGPVWVLVPVGEGRI